MTKQAEFQLKKALPQEMRIFTDGFPIFWRPVLRESAQSRTAYFLTGLKNRTKSGLSLQTEKNAVLLYILQAMILLLFPTASTMRFI